MKDYIYIEEANGNKMKMEIVLSFKFTFSIMFGTNFVFLPWIFIGVTIIIYLLINYNMKNNLLITYIIKKVKFFVLTEESKNYC